VLYTFQNKNNLVEEVTKEERISLQWHGISSTELYNSVKIENMIYLNLQFSSGKVQQAA
jgi:hypothetical protein